jgi:Flp pilus assembly secretin CpaC
MRRAISILLLVLAATLVGETALAAASSGLSVEINRSRRVVLAGAPANISVADSAIADVTVIDAHSIVVIGKSYGVTDIVVSDHAGRLLMDSSVAVVPVETLRLTVYRGVSPTDYTCLGRCQSDGEASSSSASSSPAAGPADTTGAAAIGQPPVTVTPSIPRSPP